MTSLALLRHGHTHWNRAGRIQGRSDIDIDDEARRDLSARAFPAPWDAASLVASPLSRAQETAELVGKRKPEIEDALIEMHWGDWEGQRGAQLKADPASGFRDIEHWGWSYRAPGGESPAEVWDRLSDWVFSLDQDTVAVTHIGIMRILLARATGWEFQGPAPFQVKRNRLYVLHIDGTHLSAEAEPVRLVEMGTP